MPRLIAALIRHADYQQLPDTPSAHQPFPLTDEGKIQARRGANILRETMKNNRWTLAPSVDSSQLLRAWQTAQLIIDELVELFPQSPTLNGFDALAERGLGSANNLTMRQIETIMREDPRCSQLPSDWKSNSRFHLPVQGAESLLAAGERVVRHLNQRMEALVEQSETDTLKLFVGHGAAFRHAAYHLGVISFKQIAQLSMHYAQPVYLEYLPEKRWRHIGGEWKVRTQNTKDND